MNYGAFATDERDTGHNKDIPVSTVRILWKSSLMSSASVWSNAEPEAKPDVPEPWRDAGFQLTLLMCRAADGSCHWAAAPAGAQSHKPLNTHIL